MKKKKYQKKKKTVILEWLYRWCDHSPRAKTSWNAKPSGP